MKAYFIKLTTITLVSVCLFFPNLTTLAYMSSEHYVNWMDSFNTGGTETSTSTNYNLQDTLGEIGTGQLSSTNYAGLIGFRQVEAEPKFTFSISSTSINLGTLASDSVSEANHTVTTTTNAANGYTTTIVEDGNLRIAGGSDIDDVADGTVTAGSEEYGIRTSGTHGQMNAADTAITSTTQTIASYSSWVNSDTTTISYRASISSATTGGTYTQALTIISTGNF